MRRKSRLKRLISSFEGLSLADVKKKWKRLSSDDKLIIGETIGLGVVYPPALSVVALAWGIVYKDRVGALFGRAKKGLENVI